MWVCGSVNKSWTPAFPGLWQRSANNAGQARKGHCRINERVVWGIYQASRSVRLSEEAGAFQSPPARSRISAGVGVRGETRSAMSAAANASLGETIAGAGTGAGTGARTGFSGASVLAELSWARASTLTDRDLKSETAMLVLTGSGAILATTIHLQTGPLSLLALGWQV